MSIATQGVNDALTVKLWSQRMDVEALKETTAYEFMGEGAGSLCQIMSETKKGAGDRIRWGIRMLATGAGTTENETQEGNEEGLTRYYDELLINELGHAHRVRNEGTIDRQRVPYDMREECYDSLKDWYADRIDTAFFNQLAGNTAVSDGKYLGFNAAIAPSSTRIFRGGAANTTDQAVGGDNAAGFKLSMIDKAVNRAKTTSPMLRPIKGLGKDVDYVCFIHPDQTLSLRADTATAGNWFDLQGKRLQGGEKDNNGLYTGALGIYNRTLIVENYRVPQGVHSSTGASVANSRRSIFCGAQSASLAFGKNGGKNKFKWVEDLFDYDRELGVRSSAIFGMKKTVYNSVDYGTIVLSTYAAPAS
jgi:N4-gp56 family major capsid protein